MNVSGARGGRDAGARYAPAREMLRPRTALMVGATVVCSILLSAPAALAGPAGAAPGGTATLDWATCGSLQCATLAVPLTEDGSAPGTLDLAVARLPARDPARRIGSLVVNPGGPGVPAIAYLRAVATSFPRALRVRFDLVAFDPRGVGRSDAVVCTDSLDPLFDQAFSPRTDAERAQLVDAARAVADQCEARSGALLAHVSTQDTARDLDRLRAALGDRRLTFLGSSYGSYLGAIYATSFPDRVRAMVLDGAIDPTQSSADAVASQAEGFETELDDFLADCDRRAACAFHGDAGAAAAYDALRARSARTPLRTRAAGGRTVNETRFDAAVLELLYLGRDGWPQLEHALTDADHGDASALLQAADDYMWRRADGTTSHALDAFWAISCLDGPPPGPFGSVGLERLASLSAPRLGAFVANNSVICSVWPVPTVDPAPTIRATGAPAVLVVAATGDPATPLAGGRRMRRALGNARLLVVDSDRHTSFDSGNECVDVAVTAYLVDRTLPARGARC
jgi:pimeloyl-ACP methyl ester carboxylesterase